MTEETGDETIEEVLVRVNRLNKEPMIEEVEAYGLEVEEGWTKEEIMEHFEEFLLEQAEEPEPKPKSKKKSTETKATPEPKPDSEVVRPEDIQETGPPDISVEGVPPVISDVIGAAPGEQPQVELMDEPVPERRPTPAPKRPRTAPTSDVRIMQSPGWGRQRGAHAP